MTETTKDQRLWKQTHLYTHNQNSRLPLLFIFFLFWWDRIYPIYEHSVRYMVIFSKYLIMCSIKNTNSFGLFCLRGSDLLWVIASYQLFKSLLCICLSFLLGWALRLYFLVPKSLLNTLTVEYIFFLQPFAPSLQLQGTLVRQKDGKTGTQWQPLATKFHWQWADILS